MKRKITFLFPKSCYPIRLLQDRKSAGYRLYSLYLSSEINIVLNKSNLHNFFPIPKQLLFPVLHLIFNKELNMNSDQKINFLLNYPNVKTALLWQRDGTLKNRAIYRNLFDNGVLFSNPNISLM